MRLTSFRDGKRQRGWKSCTACGVVLLIVWPWYKLFTLRPDYGALKGGPCSNAGEGHLEASVKKEIIAFVGVQTGFNTPGVPDQYNYVKRRAVLRRTWFPSDRTAIARMEEDLGIVVRFVIGHAQSPLQERAIAEEESRHGGFLRLSLLEAYGSLPAKSLAFFKAVTADYEAKYVVKVDDDAYLRIWAIPQAVKQWEGLSADYLGCMKRGQIFTLPSQRWYEPQHGLLGDSEYFTHTWGTIYVLSGRAAAWIANFNPGIMRYFNNEDVTIGSWMMALNVTHYDDRRLCETECSPSSIAVFDIPKCAGLCNPIRQMAELQSDPACAAGSIPKSDAELPLRPSVIWFKDE